MMRHKSDSVCERCEGCGEELKHDHHGLCERCVDELDEQGVELEHELEVENAVTIRTQ